MACWYENGLRFECTKCGRCCTGAPGSVWVTMKEIAVIAEFLDMDPEEFGHKYLRLVDNRLSLTERKNFDCVFLEGKKCKIYPVRPKQCGTFPFWVEIMDREELWFNAATVCPGVGHGRLYSKQEIEAIMRGGCTDA